MSESSARASPSADPVRGEHGGEHPIVALVTLWDDPGSASFVLIAIGLGFVIVGVYVVSNVWKERREKATDSRTPPRSSRAS